MKYNSTISNTDTKVTLNGKNFHKKCAYKWNKFTAIMFKPTHNQIYSEELAHDPCPPLPRAPPTPKKQKKEKRAVIAIAGTCKLKVSIFPMKLFSTRSGKRLCIPLL